MYAVSTGEDYVGYHLRGIFRSRGEAFRHARKLRGGSKNKDSNQHVLIEFWEGTRRRRVRSWSWEFVGNDEFPRWVRNQPTPGAS